ncbi:MAG: ribonuclease P protein component [Acidimicrobiia bacterium]
MRGRTRFKRAFRVGERTTVGGITVIAVAGDPGPAAVGIIASRSVGNAVVRNRARRRLREAVAKADPPAGMDVVVLAAGEVVDVPFDRLVDWVRQAMPKEET